MRYFVFYFIFFTHLFSFSQETEKELDSIQEDKVLIVVEHAPVYRGCDNYVTNNADLKKCMSQKIMELVSKKFKTSISKGLGIKEDTIKISVSFKIDTQGKITNIKAEGPHPELEKEAKRVVGSIPKMKRPAYQKGVPVAILYTLPIAFLTVKD